MPGSRRKASQFADARSTKAARFAPIMSDHIRLYIPGPVEVSDATFAAMATPMIGHRSKEFQELYGGMQPQLQQLFETKQPVFLSTSSAWGVMEGAIRNLVAKKVLCCSSQGGWWNVKSFTISAKILVKSSQALQAGRIYSFK